MTVCCYYRQLVYFSTPEQKISFAVKRRFIWVYATVQFAMVVLFSHIFYSVVRDKSIFFFPIDIIHSGHLLAGIEFYNPQLVFFWIIYRMALSEN